MSKYPCRTHLMCLQDSYVQPQAAVGEYKSRQFGKNVFVTPNFDFTPNQVLGTHLPGGRE